MKHSKDDLAYFLYVLFLDEGLVYTMINEADECKENIHTICMVGIQYFALYFPKTLTYMYREIQNQFGMKMPEELEKALPDCVYSYLASLHRLPNTLMPARELKGPEYNNIFVSTVNYPIVKSFLSTSGIRFADLDQGDFTNGMALSRIKKYIKVFVK